MLAGSGINHGGQGGTVPPSFDWGTALLNVPTKFRLRRDSAKSCSMRSHKEYITYYNFEAVIVEFQFPLYMTSVESRGTPYKNILKIVLFHFKTLIHAYMHVHKHILISCTCT